MNEIKKTHMPTLCQIVLTLNIVGFIIFAYALFTFRRPISLALRMGKSMMQPPPSPNIENEHQFVTTTRVVGQGAIPEEGMPPPEEDPPPSLRGQWKHTLASALHSQMTND